MSDQRLDIEINMQRTGDGAQQAAADLAKVKAARDGLKDQGYPATWESEPIKQTTEATTKNIEETKRGTEAKKQYKEAVKGLAMEFPTLARAMGFLANPISAMIAGLGMIVALVKDYSDSVRAAGVAAQAFEKAAGSVKALQASLKDANEAVVASLTNIGAKSDEAAIKVANLTLAIQVQQSIAENLADAKLATELEKIQTALAKGEITPQMAVMQTEDAKLAALERKETGKVEAARQQAGALRAAENEEMQRARRLREEAGGLTPDIQAADAKAAAAAADAETMTKANEAERKKNAEMLETARMWMEAQKGGSRAEKNFQMFNPIAQKTLSDQFPGMTPAQMEQEILEQQRVLDARDNQLTGYAGSTAATAAGLRGRRTALLSEAEKAEANRAKYQQDAGRTEFSMTNQGMAIPGLMAERRAASDMRTTRQVDDMYVNELKQAAKDAIDARDEIAKEYITILKRLAESDSALARQVRDLEEQAKRNRPIQ